MIFRYNPARIDRNVKRAQFMLDSMVMNDMIPLMPHQTGNFIQLTRARSAAIAGTGKVCAAAPPSGQYLYYGKVMVDPETGSPWARSGARKVLTDRDIVYNHASNPEACAKWFEVAKERNKAKWIRKTKSVFTT